jgi:hypothetical protein
VIELSADTLDAAARPLRSRVTTAPRMAADRGMDTVTGAGVQRGDTITRPLRALPGRGEQSPTEVVRA